MHQHNHRWSFISKEQRRDDHDKAKAQVECYCQERAAEVKARTHLDLHGRKGHLGYSKTMIALLKHPASYSTQAN